MTDPILYHTLTDEAIEATQVADLMNHLAIVKAFKAIEEDPRLAVDESLMDEIKALVKISRLMREDVDKLPRDITTPEQLHRLVPLYQHIQANRGRLAEIKISFMLTRDTVEEILDGCVEYCCRFPCLSKLKTDKLRDKMLLAVLQPIHNRRRAVARLFEAAGLAEANLSNAHFMLCRLQEIGERIIDHRKHTA